LGLLFLKNLKINCEEYVNHNEENIDYIDWREVYLTSFKNITSNKDEFIKSINDSTFDFNNITSNEKIKIYLELCDKCNNEYISTNNIYEDQDSNSLTSQPMQSSTINQEPNSSTSQPTQSSTINQEPNSIQNMDNPGLLNFKYPTSFRNGGKKYNQNKTKNKNRKTKNRKTKNRKTKNRKTKKYIK
jgi:hypothetical protein